MEKLKIGKLELNEKEEKKLGKELKLINRELKLIGKMTCFLSELKKTTPAKEAKLEVTDSYHRTSKLLCIKKFSNIPEVTKLVRNVRRTQSRFMKSIDFGVVMYKGDEVLKLGKIFK